MENSKFVGAGPVSAHTSKAKQNKGITLIALVITIIVMLILVAVTISIAVNGGLFDYAGKAVGDTENARDEEQQLASGKIKVGDTWYDSIDDYINNIPSGTQSGETTEGGNVEDGSDDNITEEEPKEETPTELSVGDYISNYPVEYTNVATYTYNGTDSYYPDEKFENKWRVLSIEKDEEGIYTNVRLISAGVPLTYYHYDDTATSIANLTTGFLTTEINSSTATKYKFYKCGFKSVTGKTLAGTFSNDYTESVQSLTKDDIDGVVGSEIDTYTYLNKEEYGELLALSCEDKPSGYAWTYLASMCSSNALWCQGANVGLARETTRRHPSCSYSKIWCQVYRGRYKNKRNYDLGNFALMKYYKHCRGA